MIAAVALLGAFFRLSPWSVSLPAVLRQFVTEPQIHQHGLSVRHKYHFRLTSYLLLVLSAIGLGAQIAVGIYPDLRKDMMFPSAAWLAIIALLIVEHSATTPYSILALNISLVITQSIIYVDGTLDAGYDFVSPHSIVLVAIAAALMSILVVFHMPMRHPMLANDDISATFTTPTSALRSPEDNLTLWQFLTASWVAPLLAMAKKQDINKEDVWDLAYQFKHGLLHEKFRKLKGSVLRRLLDANGLDLIILTIVNLVRVFSRT